MVNKFFAPAKVNLYLHVLGKRADGYHLLDSLMVFADIGDEITIISSDSLELEIEGENSTILRKESDNLVLKAARILGQAVGIEPKVKITLVKNLPIAAGLGGGSSDAAATLRGLLELWNVKFPENELMKLGLKLGADVPVCLRQKPCFVGGIGEELTEVPPLPKVGIVLVNPNIPLSTPNVFKERKGGFSAAARFSDSSLAVREFVNILRARNNDLMAPAIRICPQIEKVLSIIEQSSDCLLSRMSGSGATCFGIYPDAKAAHNAARTIASNNPEWWCRGGALL